MITAILEHMVLLFAFRHNGAGLPRQGAVPYILLAGAAVTTALRGTLDLGDFLTAAVLSIVGIGIVIVAVRNRPSLVAPIALTCIGGDTLAILATIAGFPSLAMIATVWQIAAIVYFSMKHAQA